MLKNLLDEHNVKYVESDGLSNKENITLYDHKGKLFDDHKILSILKELLL